MAVLLLLPSSGVAGVASIGGYSESGTIGGAPFRIEIPRAWNGTVLLYGPGFLDEKDDEGERASAGARAATVAPDVSILGDGATEDLLLARGYGLAGTRYAADGFRFDGVRDLLSLARYLQDIVASRPQVVALGNLRNTLLATCSLGSVFAYELAGRKSAPFDGVLTLGGVGGGADRAADLVLAYRLAYDAAFGWPREWGRVEDVRNAGDDPKHPDELDWENETLPAAVALLADPRNFSRLEFIRLVLGYPLTGFYPGTAAHPGNLPWLFTLQYFASEVSAQLEAAVGGPPYQNIDHEYRLSAEDEAYLRTIDPSLEIPGLLARMNATRVHKTAPRQQMLTDFGFGRDIRRPVLTMKNISDGVAPAWHDGYLARQADPRARSAFLVQVYVDAASHCALSPGQLLEGVESLQRWVQSGRRPVIGDFSAANGFLDDYSPPESPFGAR